MSEYNKHQLTKLATLAVVVIIISNLIPAYADPVITTTSLTQNNSPLMQFKSGTGINDIQCKEGHQLVIRAEDNFPACVKPTSATRLILLGWAIAYDNSGQDQSSNKVITLADSDKTINLKEGESFLLKLGENFNWNIEIDNQTVVSRVMNIMVVRGAQGVYQAHAPGVATFTGVGDPLCLTSTPPCKIHSILFKLNVTVASTNPTSLIVSSDKEQYKIGEPVNFTITNNGNAIIYPVGWGYSINGIDGTHYAPNGVLRMMLIALSPGNSTHWTWDQADANGTQVSPGQYNITATYTRGNTQNQIISSKIIEIISQ